MRKTKLSVSYVSQIIKKLETLCYEYDFFFTKIKIIVLFDRYKQLHAYHTKYNKYLPYFFILIFFFFYGLKDSN